jgi:tmRNA-binding protein
MTNILFIEGKNNEITVVSEDISPTVLSNMLNIKTTNEKILKFNRNELSKHTHKLTHMGYKCYYLNNLSKL